MMSRSVDEIQASLDSPHVSDEQIREVYVILVAKTAASMSRKQLLRNLATLQWTLRHSEAL
jgi:hypothetical protein